MGFWFNNFLEFERKQNRQNRLILNLRYVSENVKEERNVKLYVPQNVRIPTGFLMPEKADELVSKLKASEDFSCFPINEKQVGKFKIVNIEIPNDRSLTKNLPKSFQIRNYDKMLKFGGFFPERKVSLESIVLEKIGDKEEIELNSLEGINFEGFLSKEEMKSLPYLVIDIEKPFWKKTREKQLIDLRKKLMKQNNKFEKIKNPNLFELNKNIKRRRIIGKLEERLTTHIEGVGEVKLYDERFNADISYVQTIFGRGDKIEVKELYVIDPYGEIKKEEHNSYKILKFKNEKELINALLLNIHERKPVISIGHNQVYDITQLKFAFEDNKILFDPAVKGVKPRRDFVRMFLQRLREDLIYVDTLWLGKIFYPYLTQGRFGTSHKLEGLAHHLGIPFEKSLQYEELREVEARRLFGKTEEIRKEATEKMMDYSVDDIDTTKEIIDKMDPFPFLVEMKNVLPFATLSEIAFSPNIINKLHEYIHFSKNGNLPFYGYGQKERQNELDIFNKRFPSFKTKRLRDSGLNRHVKGTHENVMEFYLPLEDWTEEVALKLAPELATVKENLEEDGEKSFAFSQFKRSFMRSVYSDYYFARREKRIYDKCLKHLGLNFSEASFLFKDIEGKAGIEELNKLIGSFKYLKNHFRSVYVSLETPQRRLILPNNYTLSSVKYPCIMESDADLFLLRNNSDKISPHLTNFNKRNLDSFLNNFDRFDELLESIGKLIPKEHNINDTLYSLIYRDRNLRTYKTFFAKYDTSLEDFSNLIQKGYCSLALSLKEKEFTFLDHIGDYIFVQGEGDLDSAIKIRNLDRFEIK